MAVHVIENYMKKTAEAVWEVARAVESSSNRIRTAEDAAQLSVALYGAPPKPSVESVVSLFKPCRLDRALADSVLLNMSVARIGHSKNATRASNLAEDIRIIMEDVTGKSYVDKMGGLMEYGQESLVHIGRLSNDLPVVEKLRYVMGEETSPDKVDLDKLKKNESLQRVADNLTAIFEHVQTDSGAAPNNLNSVKKIVSYVNLVQIKNWADIVEDTIRSSAHESSEYAVDQIVSRNAAEVKRAVLTIHDLVGNSYCKTVTQLTTAQEVLQLRNAANTCYEALMADTEERASISVLFNVCFRVMEGEPREYVKARLGSTAGDRRPLKLARRTAEEMLFGICFMFKMLPSQFVSCLINFPAPKTTCYHGLTGSSLQSVLCKYGLSFEKPWNLFNELLNERGRLVKSVDCRTNRIDNLDAAAAHMGPVYVLVLDLARTFSYQRNCSKNFLDEIKEQYSLWNKFTEGSASGPTQTR